MALGLVLLSCFDNSTGSNNSIDSNEPIYFGITSTNALGDILSIDPDDWSCSETSIYSDSVSYKPIPSEFCFNPAYPNPFNGVITIEFSLPVKSVVTIIIYKPNGQKLSELLVGQFEAGVHVLEWVATDQPEGIYRVTIAAGDWTSHGDVQIKYN